MRSSSKARRQAGQALVWLIAIGLFSAACGTAAAKTATVTVTAGGGGTTQASQPPSSSNPNRKEVPFGGTVTDGSFRFKVTSSTKPPYISLGQYMGTLHPKPGTHFQVVKVKVTNTTNVPNQDPFCGDSGAQLIDSLGKNYDWSSDQTFQVPNNNICGDNVQPGEPTSYTLIFDVPKSAGTIKAIALWDTTDMSDINGQSYGVVDLPQ